MPRCFRPRLSAAQQRDLSLAHHTHLDLIATGQADSAVLWQWAGAVLTWSRVAQLLGAGEAEVTPQLELVERVLARFQRTGQVCFSGPDYQVAKDGVVVMDLLAAAVDMTTAGEAACWADRRLNGRLRAAAA